MDWRAKTTTVMDFIKSHKSTVDPIVYVRVLFWLLPHTLMISFKHFEKSIDCLTRTFKIKKSNRSTVHFLLIYPRVEPGCYVRGAPLNYWCRWTAKIPAGPGVTDMAQGESPSEVNEEKELEELIWTANWLQFQKLLHLIFILGDASRNCPSIWTCTLLSVLVSLYSYLIGVYL